MSEEQQLILKPIITEQLMFQIPMETALFQIAFGMVVLIASIQFLKLRKWARNALEVICWLWLAYILVYVLLLGKIALEAMIASQEGFRFPPDVAMRIVLWGVIPSILLIIIIRLLHGKTIKEAVS